MIKRIGQLPFHQWEIDRQISVENIDYDEINWHNKNMEEALRTEPSSTIIVPNILLQEAENIYVYLLKNEQVVYCTSFGVCPRPRPEDYIYKETQHFTYKKLENLIKNQIGGYTWYIDTDCVVSRLGEECGSLNDCMTDEYSGTWFYAVTSTTDAGSAPYPTQYFIDGANGYLSLRDYVIWTGERLIHIPTFEAKASEVKNADGKYSPKSGTDGLMSSTDKAYLTDLINALWGKKYFPVFEPTDANPDWTEGHLVNWCIETGLYTGGINPSCGGHPPIVNGNATSWELLVFCGKVKSGIYPHILQVAFDISNNIVYMRKGWQDDKGNISSWAETWTQISGFGESHNHNNKEVIDKVTEDMLNKVTGSEQLSNKGIPGGYAELDKDARLPKTQLTKGVEEILSPILLEPETKTSVEGEAFVNVMATLSGNAAIIKEYTWGGSKKYTDVDGYDRIEISTFGVYGETIPAVVFFNADDNMISHIHFSEEKGYHTFDEVIPEGTSYVYVNNRASVDTIIVSLIKNAVYKDRVVISRDNLDDDLKETMESHALYDYVNRKVVRLPQFMSWKYPVQDGQSSFSNNFFVEGRWMYLLNQNYIYKIDVGCEVEPVVVQSNRFVNGVSYCGYTGTGLAVTNDYIYVGTRRATAAYPSNHDYDTDGAIFVLNKSDLSVVKSFNLFPDTTGVTGYYDTDGNFVNTSTITDFTMTKKKVSRFILHDNYLIVNLQMLGWQIYDIGVYYDDEGNITNDYRANPQLIYNEHFVEDASNIEEAQGGEVFEHNGKGYYAQAGFGLCGIRLFDITDPHNVVKKWQFYFSDSAIKSKMHTYSLTVNYPYLYATMGNEAKYNDDPNRLQGILTIDLTDHLETVPAEYKLSLIADEDKNTSVTDSDTEPTIIKRIGKTIVVNNDARGIAVFDASEHPQQPEYEGIYTPSNDCCIYKMEATADGRLFLCDGSKGAGRMYLVRGLSNYNDVISEYTPDTTVYIAVDEDLVAVADEVDVVVNGGDNNV